MQYFHMAVLPGDLQVPWCHASSLCSGKQSLLAAPVVTRAGAVLFAARCCKQHVLSLHTPF
jgi:hypothetical protein